MDVPAQADEYTYELSEQTTSVMNSDFSGFLITWTTYGTWLPGDSRGWRARIGGPKEPDIDIELDCAARLTAAPVFLSTADRAVVELAIKDHCSFRDWNLLAVNARSNHVHVVVQAIENPQTVRNQLKANCTRMLRNAIEPLQVEKTWTKGGDCHVLKDDQALENAIRYVLEAQ